MSLSDGQLEYLAVGKLHRPHGVHGELIFQVYTDFPERLQKGVMVFIGGQYQPHTIRSRRPNGSTLLLAFDGLDTPEQAGELRNQVVFVPALDRPPLPEGEYYHHELIGMRVVTEDDRELGKLVEILSSPANDVYIVRPEAGKELLLPALKSVILDVDKQQGLMRVHLLPGLEG
jgi:16S rRNA processing protein RimM